MKESFFKFNDPYLMKCEYHENPDFDINKFGNIQIVSNIDTKNNFEKNEAFVSVEMSIGSNENSPFSLTIQMGAFFSWNDSGNSFDNKMIESLLKYNAPSLLIGYIRPIIANITASSRFPTLNIPFMDIRDE